MDAVKQPNALTSYLAAVIGARTNNRDAVYGNLRKTVSLDGCCLQNKALVDLEFSKFFTDEALMRL